ncbi:putative F-box protein [Cardamine amara subsp. amara]|uniref:F-box protein n=1 Tax=Cardamine amara subsp. amara TaxID=228776 RepID=A0ABD1ARB5_CARAN
MDRISNLPDEIICHILSFLTTNEAALTSILSKKWRNLFALVPNLDIDYDNFQYSNQGKRDIDGLRKSFMDSIDRVLALQGNSPIKKFSLKCTDAADSVRVDSWISNVLVRGVSELQLSIILDSDSIYLSNYRLSPKCFESKKLVKLEIGDGLEIGRFDESVFLPMLKTLVLDSIYVDTCEFLLHALPALEELVLIHVY